MSKKLKVLSSFTILLTIFVVGALSYSHVVKAQISPTGPYQCGNNIKEPGEECDGKDLGGCPGCKDCQCLSCNEAAYQDYANCSGSLVPNFNESACLRVLPPCFKCGDCQLDDFVWLFVNLGTWGIRVLPVAALLFLIWGGVRLLISAGNASKIEEGKKMIVSVLVGVIIVLVVAWTMTAFIVWLLTDDIKANIFGRPWYGTGEPQGQPGAGQGCCITSLDCFENFSKESCDAYKDFKPDWKEGEQCIPTYKTLCENIKMTWPDQCCVPNDITNSDCKKPKPTTVCTTYTGYTLKPQSCLEIGQCMNLEEANPGCCVSDTGKCEKPIGIGTCSPGFSFRSDSCLTISSCAGCCYNGGNPNPDQCLDGVVSYDCTYTAWEKGACTPAMCGRTCCSYSCGVATPNVVVSDCTSAGGRPSDGDDPTGNCNADQLQALCCRIVYGFSPTTCYDNYNLWYAKQVYPNDYDCAFTKCSENIDPNIPREIDCAPPVVIEQCS